MLIDGIYIERPLDKYARRGRLRGECHFIGTALAIGLGVASAAGAIGSSAIAAHGAGQAADAQVNAANHAADVQAQASRDALSLQKDQFAVQQQNISPWLNIGRGGLVNLANLMGLPISGDIPGTPGTPGSTIRVPSGNINPGDDNSDTALDGFNNEGGQSHSGLATRGGATFMDQAVPGTPGTPSTPLSSLINPALGATGSLNFVPPTAATEMNDPGFQFRLDQGQKAITNSAAAKGNLLSGATAKAAERYAQDYSSNEYQNVYNRELANNTAQFNKLAAISGVGQNAASTLNADSQNFANNASNITINAGNNAAQGINNAGAARASGYVGGANAWSSGIGGLTSNLSSLALLNSIYKKPVVPAAASGWGVI